MKKIAFITALLSYNVALAGGESLFSESLANQQKYIDDSSWEFCASVKNMGKKATCLEKKTTELQEETSLRGSEWYQKNVLSKLSLEEAKKALSEAEQLKNQAETAGIYMMNAEPGYLTVEGLSMEVYFLRDKIHKIESAGKPTLSEQAEALGAPGLAQEIRNTSN